MPTFSQIRRARLFNQLKKANDLQRTLGAIVGGSAGLAPGLGLLGAGIGGTVGALRGGSNAANDAVQGAATGGLTGAGAGVGSVTGAVLANLLAKKLNMGGQASGMTTAGGGLLGGLVGGYSGNRLAKGLRKKEKEAGEKKAFTLVELLAALAATTAAGGTAGPAGSRAAGGAPGTGSAGGIVGAAGGAVGGGLLGNLMPKKIRSATTPIGALTGLVGGAAGGGALEGKLRPAPKAPKAPEVKTANEKTAFYACCGDRYIVMKGEHKGRIGVCTKHNRSDSTEEYMDDDGAKVTKRKDSSELTLKFSDGTTYTTNTPDGHVSSYYGDKIDRDDDRAGGSDCCAESPVKAAAAMDPQEMPQAKLAAIIRRVINGDEGLEQIIQHLKSARSKPKT